jgi:tetratricopeptide (TPR) repeat protein
MKTGWQIGDRIQGRYEVRKILPGGMGIIYVVYDREDSVPLALKTFRDEVFARNLRIAERFRQEARIWINLDSHQNVTEARMVQQIEGKPYLFLEYVSGGDLSSWIGTPRLTEDLPQLLRFAIHFCDGMTHALFKGVTAHRDVKPQNCLVTQDNTLKVTDFGLAKVFDDVDMAVKESSAPDAGRMCVGLTHTGATAGTPTHMAPEQFDDAKHVDVQADIYSFGVMLYQMLTGRVPFKGRTWDELKRQHKGAAPPPLVLKDREVAEVVERCLAKEASERFRNFGEVREQLRDIYRRLTGEFAPRSALASMTDPWREHNKGVSLAELGYIEESLGYYDKIIEEVPTLATTLVNKGGALRRLGRLEEALTYLDRAIEANVRDVRAWVVKGGVMGELGRTDEELYCLDRALEINPRSDFAWNNKGWALSKKGEIREALSCYDHALEANPRLEQTWINKAGALSRLGQTEEALSCLDRALEINPRFAKVWAEKAEALYRLGLKEEAIACYDQALEIAPHDERVLNTKGVFLGGVGRHNEALSCLDRAIEIDPRFAEAYLNKSVALWRLGRSEESLACLDHALEINPRYGEAWSNKGTFLDKLERKEEALACLDRALEINPQLVNAWFHKGVVLANDGRYNEASECLEEAQRLGHPEAAQLLAQCRQMMGATYNESAMEWFNKATASADSEEQLACYDRALEIEPSLMPAWFNKAITLRDAGLLDDALTCFDRVIEITPGFADAWVDKGWVLIRMNRMEEALACMVGALRLNPRDELAWSYRAWTLAELGRYGEALSCYDRAIEINPRGADAWAAKGRMLHELGRMGESVECCSRALEIDPRHAEAWFGKGMALVNGSRRYREALECFEQARQSGHPGAAEALTWCRQRLRG